MDNWLAALIEAGILQFGHFDGCPIHFNFALLPSYPDLLNDLAMMAAPLVGQVDHLVATSDALALGTALALQTRVPLVYSQGGIDSPAFDLVGAYDIGHPALLVDLVILDAERVARLAEGARTVGLEINRCLCLIATPGQAALAVEALIDMDDVLDQLVAAGEIPAAHADRVSAWLRGQR